MSTTPGPPEDQARLLEDALVAVRQQTVLMRKCLDTPGKLMDALKCWYVNHTLPPEQRASSSIVITKLAVSPPPPTPSLHHSPTPRLSDSPSPQLSNSPTTYPVVNTDGYFLLVPY